MGLTNNLGKLSNMITSTGSAVGIAQPSPAYTLDVTGTGRFTGALTGTSATFSNFVQVTLPALFPIIPTNGMYLSAANTLNFATNTTNRLSISSLGTLASTANFISTTFTDTPSTGSTVAGNATYNYLGYSGYWGIRTTATGSNFALDTYNGGTPKNVLTVTQAGNVGIGTSIPNLTAASRTSVDINGTSTSLLSFSSGGTYKGYLYNDGTNLTINTTGVLAFEAGSVERMRITSYGSVCFGVTNSPGSNPAYKAAFTDAIAMSVSANGNNMINFFNGSGTYVASIAVAASSVAYNTTSDYRLKKDLKDFDGLNLLSNIKVYDFAWKLDNTRTYGVVAHELADVLPSAVSGEKDGENIQGVDYSKLVPILVKAIQELKAEIDELKNK